MEKLKEILRTIRAYASIYQFWLMLGGGVLVAAGVFAWLTLPLMERNDERLSELQSLQSTLEGYANSEQLPRPALVDAIKQQQQKYEQQLEEIETRLAEYDQWIEREFREEGAPDEKLGPTDWKVVYNDRWDELEDKLYESIPNVQSSLIRRDFGATLPSDAEMRAAEKRYWIQKAIIDTIARLNAARVVVPVFGGFEFTETPQRLLSPSHGIVRLTGSAGGTGTGMGGMMGMGMGGGGMGGAGTGGTGMGGTGMGGTGTSGTGMTGTGTEGTDAEEEAPGAEAVAPGGGEAAYRAIPFRLQVSLEFKHIPMLMRELLGQEATIEITGMNLQRTRQRIYGTGRRGEGQGPGGMPYGGDMGGYGGYRGMGGPGMEGGPSGGVSPYMMGRMRESRQPEQEGGSRRGRGGRDEEEEQQEQQEEGQKKLLSVTITGYVADYIQEGELNMIAKQLQAEGGGGGRGSMPGMEGRGGMMRGMGGGRGTSR